MSSMKGTQYDCGCVHGYYWCARHDIYHKQDLNDLPPHGHYQHDGKIIARPIDEKPTGCSCHIVAPCSYCTDIADKEE